MKSHHLRLSAGGADDVPVVSPAANSDAARRWVCSVAALKALGITVPRQRGKPRSGSIATKTGIFGKPLTDVLIRQGKNVDGILIPSCVHQLVNILSKESVLKTEGLLRVGGSSARVSKQKICIDEGNDVKESTVPHDMSSLLKSYLRELPVGLLNPMFGAFVQAEQLGDENKLCRAVSLICQLLPAEHRDLLLYLVRFCNLVCSYEEWNKMTPSNLSIILTPNILYESSAAIRLDAQGTKKLGLLAVEQMIQNPSLVSSLPGDVEEEARLMDVKEAEKKYRDLTSRARKRRSSIRQMSATALKRVGDAGVSLKNALRKSNSYNGPEDSPSTPKKSLMTAVKNLTPRGRAASSAQRVTTPRRTNIVNPAAQQTRRSQKRKAPGGGAAFSKQAVSRKPSLVDPRKTARITRRASSRRASTRKIQNRDERITPGMSEELSKLLASTSTDYIVPVDSSMNDKVPTRSAKRRRSLSAPKPFRAALRRIGSGKKKEKKSAAAAAKENIETSHNIPETPQVGMGGFGAPQSSPLLAATLKLPSGPGGSWKGDSDEPDMMENFEQAKQFDRENARRRSLRSYARKHRRRSDLCNIEFNEADELTSGGSVKRRSSRRRKENKPPLMSLSSADGILATTFPIQPPRSANRRRPPIPARRSELKGAPEVCKLNLDGQEVDDYSWV